MDTQQAIQRECILTEGMLEQVKMDMHFHSNSLTLQASRYSNLHENSERSERGEKSNALYVQLTNINYAMQANIMRLERAQQQFKKLCDMMHPPPPNSS